MKMAQGGRFDSIAGGLAVLLFLSGCAEMPSWIPFQGQTTDTLPGVVTPAQKIAQLKKLRLEAPENNAEFKRQAVAYLTKSIAAEPDPLIRSEIIKTLAEYPLPEAEPVLRAALEYPKPDPDAEVRIAACDAWGKRPGPAAAEVLAEVLKNDGELDVRLAAARGLGQTKEQRAIAALGDVLADSDPAMQRRAVLSLQNITEQDLGNNVERWQKFVKEENPRPAQPVSIAEKIKKMF
ncbi:MAG: HEAT repeat domain-containing protein [Pirellulales bacterium]|nr:HEAT repeat domain-containing protein [Pirellulales bacterium]